MWKLSNLIQGAPSKTTTRPLFIKPSKSSEPLLWPAKRHLVKIPPKLLNRQSQFFQTDNPNLQKKKGETKAAPSEPQNRAYRCNRGLDLRVAEGGSSGHRAPTDLGLWRAGERADRRAHAWLLRKGGGLRRSRLASFFYFLTWEFCLLELFFFWESVAF